MSATNRGAKRKESDFYPTPYSAIESFLLNYGMKTDSKILEPCAGNGNIIRCLRDFGYKNIDAVEIREEEKHNLYELADNVYIEDFLKANHLNGRYDVIITNPPFSQALEFIEKSLDIVKPGGLVIMLLRTNFLESKRRFDFWQKHPLTGLYVLHQRPSFTGKGTDATSYSWFVWRENSHDQRIAVI